jgi:hypothetical protein
MAMLTNAYETQVVQSLGVRIGSESSGEARADASVGTGSRCPFTAMIPGTEESTKPGESIRWTPAAEARLANIPEFVRPMARVGIEKFATENGSQEVDEKVLDAARDFFGM